MFNQKDLMLSFPMEQSQSVHEFIKTYHLHYYYHDHNVGTINIACGGHMAMYQIFHNELLKVNFFIKF